MPERPAVAGAASLRLAPTEWIDPRTPSHSNRAVGLHLRPYWALASNSASPGATCRARQHHAERHARLGAFRDNRKRGLGVARLHGGDARLRGRDIVGIALDADIAAAQGLATAPVVPVPKNGSSTRSPGFVVASSTRCSSASGFCVGCAFLPPSSLQPLRAGADREQPVRAHLQVVVERLQRLVVEGGRAASSRAAQISVSCALVKRLPRKFGIGFDLAPDDVVLDPEAEILQRHAERGRCCDRSRSPRSRRSASGRGGIRRATCGELIVGRECRTGPRRG